MPTYEYRCKKCLIHFDVFHSMTVKAIETCKECGGEVERTISKGSGIHFKGTGFYETDYKGKDK